MIRLSSNKSILLAVIALLVTCQAMPAMAKCDCQADCDHGCCPSIAELQPPEALACCSGEAANSEYPLSLRSTECSCQPLPVSGPQVAVTAPDTSDTSGGKRGASALPAPLLGGAADVLPDAGWSTADASKVYLARPSAIYLVNSSFLA